jgi:hypothetical protein
MHAGRARFQKDCKISSENLIAWSDVWAMAMLYCRIVTKEARQQVGLEVGSIAFFYMIEVW